MGSLAELLMIASFFVSLIFAIIALGLTFIAQRSSEMTSYDPFITLFIILLLAFVVLSPISFFYYRDENTTTKFPIPYLLLLIVLSIAVIGAILIRQSIQTLELVKFSRVASFHSNLQEIVHVETKELKITIGAGAIGLAGAILYGLAKIMDVSKCGKFDETEVRNAQSV